MLIGVDASRATAGQPTGTENYSLHLIRELLALERAHRFRLYFNQAPAPGLLPEVGEWRVIPFPRLWTHVRLSWEMATQPPDLLFVPSHVLPAVRPRASVVTVHDLGYHYYPEAHTRLQRTYLEASTRFNARAARRVVADSVATRQDLIRLYHVDPAKVTVVYPGRDERMARVTDLASQAHIRARLGIPGPYVLYVGTLHPRKNLVRLVQAFGRAAADLDASLHLVLAGKKGWLYDEIFAHVQRLGLGGRVLFPGYVARDDLPALLSGATAFAYPSLHEGFGFPVLEAMACGVPVVCSNSSSLPEVAGDAALLVDPLDAEALARALLQVVTDPGLRRTLVERGFEQVQRFSWRRCAQEVLRILEEAGGAID